jgi:AcrR family transcriptional regulator
MSSKKTESKDRWLEEGYRQFALYGPDKLSINQISKEISASRASFYHFFGDTDLFIEELLAKHWQTSLQFNAMGKEQCRALLPDLYELLGQFTIPLSFSLQLFHHRSDPRYNYLFSKTYAVSSDAFTLKLFADHLGLNPQDQAVYNLWFTMGEAWYSRLDLNDLSAATLQRHAEEVMASVTSLMNSRLYATLQYSS